MSTARKVMQELMTSHWLYEYEGNIIEIKRFKSTELYVNNVLQDTENGRFNTAYLSGKLPDGKIVEAYVSGFLVIKSTLFVENKEISAISNKLKK